LQANGFGLQGGQWTMVAMMAVGGSEEMPEDRTQKIWAG
jgi:hypothetical protein